MSCRYCCPVIAVEFPLNQEGQGPEMDASKVVKIEWHVWDGAHETICVCDNKEAADWVAGLIERELICRSRG